MPPTQVTPTASHASATNARRRIVVDLVPTVVAPIVTCGWAG
jgi:hypothetical protein